MNPYEILQVSRDATDDEVKKAYRTLSKKYHPDANIGSPHQAEYTELFKQVQSAYDMIMAERRGDFSHSGFTQNTGAGFNGYQYSSDAEAYRDVQAYLQTQRFAEASSVLAGIRNKTDVWFYFSAIAEHGMGNIIRAREYAETAYQMNPMNFQYQILLQQLGAGQRAYSTMSQSYGRTVSPVRCCWTFMMLQFVANMCCGGHMLPLICCL